MRLGGLGITVFHALWDHLAPCDHTKIPAMGAEPFGAARFDVPLWELVSHLPI